MSQVQTEITVAEFLRILAGRLTTFDQSDLSSKVAGLTATMEQLETLRLLSIGAPKIHRSQVLPPDHVWVNGDFIPFSIAPELKKVYDEGGFSGMLMKFNASASEQAANKGKFRPNAAIPTGLYLPVLGDEFIRVWTIGLSREAGSSQLDAMMNLYGEFSVSAGTNYGSVTSIMPLTNLSGVFKGVSRSDSSYAASGWDGCNNNKTYKAVMDASTQVRTAKEFRPPNTALPVITYIGKTLPTT